MAAEVPGTPPASDRVRSDDRERDATHGADGDSARAARSRIEIPVSYAVPGERSSPKWARAFSIGCNGRATNVNELQPGPVALFGSPSRHDLLQQAIAQGH